MFKSFVSKHGEIRYFELIKMVFLMAFLTLYISSILDRTMYLASQTTSMTVIIYLLFIIQVIVLNLEGLKDLKELVLRKLITFISIKIKLPKIIQTFKTDISDLFNRQNTFLLFEKILI